MKPNQSFGSIVVCMGSSCYARGNIYTVEHIQSWLARHGLLASVELSGSLCGGRCKEGPVIIINGKVYTNVMPETIEDILVHEFEKAGDPELVQPDSTCSNTSAGDSWRVDP